MPRSPLRVGWPEVAGLLLLLSCIGWALLTTVRLDRGLPPTSPYVLAPVVLGVGVALGRRQAQRADDRRTGFALLVLGILLVLGVLLTSEPGKNPLGYANANAALAVQVVALCGLTLLSSPPADRRRVLVALSLAAVATALNRSAAGVAVVVPVLVTVGLVVRRRPRHRWWLVPPAAAVAVAGAVVIVRAAASPVFPRWADRLFDPVREQLWQDAVALWRAHPSTGSGVGSFRHATALSVDPDTSTAHSSVLQIGSETGWVGVVLFALVGVAGLLWAIRGRAPQAIIAMAAWTALLVHSYVDHLLDFPPVVLAAGVVLGWAGGSRDSEELDVPERERPVPR